jgi:hypothetical protein
VSDEGRGGEAMKKTRSIEVEVDYVMSVRKGG